MALDQYSIQDITAVLLNSILDDMGFTALPIQTIKASLYDHKPTFVLACAINAHRYKNRNEAFQTLLKKMKGHEVSPKYENMIYSRLFKDVSGADIEMQIKIHDEPI